MDDYGIAMSSAQEPHLLPPPKPKLSPLELRNTDLVSRLLAATPPYLYNMSLLPNTYFFSEMLRSFVQAKNEQRGNVGNGFGANNMFYGHQMRRPRKRGWSNMARENYPQNNTTIEERMEKPSEKTENNEPWMIKSMRKSEESALELTTSVGNTTPHQKLEDHQFQKTPKLEEPPTPFTTQQQENSSNLVLPPPPPIWYPPIYPTPPFGIDPLHFFIDLRVSGHIYDRQNNNQEKDAVANASQENSTIVGEPESNIDQKELKMEDSGRNMFKQKRHCSAFSVPNANGLSKPHSNDKNQTKFDVKSMGFDKSSHKTSTNYIMGNISKIYKNLAEKKAEISYNMPPRTINIEEPMTIDVDTDEHVSNTPNKNIMNISEESEAEKQKKVKDLRALIGLELVVDYMDHKKRVVRSDESSIMSEEGELSSEVESCESPQLEVVAIHDEV